MGWIRRETEKGTTQYICPNCHDYHEFREDFGEQTFSENFIFCRRCGARNGTGTVPTLTPPNEWVNRVRELDELYTKLQIVTGFTAEQLLEIFAAGYTLEKPDYSKKFAEMENLAEAAQPNEPLTMEELREMDGEPVYIIAKDMGIAEWNVITGKEPIAIAYDCPMPGFKSVVEGIAFANGRAFRAGAYGITWLAYRRPPEGEANA